jgi:cytidylate kinase
MNNRDLSVTLVRALLRSQAEAPGPRAPAGVPNPTRPPFSITISREAGALGHSVAAEVGRRLGWPVYDRELLGMIAEEMRRHPSQLEAVDERPDSWLEECLSGLLSKYSVSSDAYLKYLFGTVRGLGAVGRCVVVGRGANFILPAETTLRVRLVAAREDRVQAVARRLNLSAREAVAWVDRTERERALFARLAFRQDVEDPHHYDVVLNTSRLSVEEAADAVIQVLRRFEGRGSPAGGNAEPAARPAPRTVSPGVI